MDLIRIGQYIAGKRKALGLTQKQLAEKLGVSDKSVSKWERGVCLPDVSLYTELCAALGMTLLAGSGPRIPISIVPVGSVQTDFETEFEACGINQTRHKVYLQLSASIRIVIPTGAKTTNVTANMLVTESIIVGKVPESFVGYRLSEEELNMTP